MANRIPVKAIFTGSDVTALGEFASGDTIDVSYIADGTITAAKLAADTATQAELDTVSGVASAALPLAGGTMTGNIAHASDFTLDVGGDITLDAGGGDIRLDDDGTEFGILFKTGDNLYIKSTISDGNLVFQGNDGGASTTALTLDMSEAGKALFNAGASFGSGVDVTGSATGTLTTDNDGSFDMSASNNFKCTPSGDFTLTFTNIVSQSGFILLVNSGGHTVSAHANSKVDANLLATVTAAGTYLISYFSDGTNVYLTNSAIYT